MHRTGTSVLVRMLEAMGFYAGDDADFSPPTPHDPLDYREHKLVWGINETALQWVGKAWDDPVDVNWDLLAAARRADVLGAINQAIAVLDTHSHWVAKDPRLCLTLPLWRMVSEPTCVLTHRNPLEVAHSLRSRDGIPLFGGIALWEAYQRSALRHSQGLARIVVGFAEMAEEPAAFADRLALWLRHLAPDFTLGSNPTKPSTFNGGLIRQRRSSLEVAAYLNPAQQRLLLALDSTVAGEPRAQDAIAAASAEPLSEQSADIIGTLAGHRRKLSELEQRVGEVSDWNEKLTADRAHRRSQG